MQNPAFEIDLNGQKIATSKVNAEFGVLTAILTWVKRTLDNTESLNLDVSGLDSVKQIPLKWLSRPLAIGDTVTISITESDNLSPQIKVKQLSEEVIIANKLAAYHKLKEELKDYL
ncbi:hypothetical protein EZ456_21365 [Pedobacter psychrodurus]|uniref:Uncharacterized protein n=1 Tax=Pedobacter psychrodurus TaxID=2530456 RepID=A0A4R0PQI3_9SPHI|nr:hypothetical protein [Pedobacter psychrodurus]TCD18626.1 hypothetical protein EZ456_21365 [Pedobacter psychrodurus]